MSSKEKKIVGIIILTFVLIIGGIFVITKNKKVTTNETKQNTVKEEFVKNLEDGTKLNTSNKLKETKKIDELEVGNIQLTEKGNVTLLIADIKNNTTQKKGGYPVILTILDKQGKELAKLDGFLGEVQPGKTQQMSVSVTTDLANAYDFKIVKK